MSPDLIAVVFVVAWLVACHVKDEIQARRARKVRRSEADRADLSFGIGDEYRAPLSAEDAHLCIECERWRLAQGTERARA